MIRRSRLERVAALGSLLGVAALAWAHLWQEAARMSSTAMVAASAASFAASPVWTAEWLVLTFLMWTVMMIAMMLPSAAPAILLYASIAKSNRARGTSVAPLWVFTIGYLAAWTAFSLMATVLQAGLQASSLVTPMMVSDSGTLSAMLLIVAGIYQWLPAKEACLEKCRDPLQLILFHWRPGAGGAFRMGVEHGAFCTGCCWALMLLLFVAGVMNVLWVAAIAAYVLVEKLVPQGPWIGRIAGIALAGSGILMLV